MLGPVPVTSRLLDYGDFVWRCRCRCGLLDTVARLGGVAVPISSNLSATVDTGACQVLAYVRMHVR